MPITKNTYSLLFTFLSVFILTLTLSSPLQAQGDLRSHSVEVKGKVTDKNNGDSLPGVTVIVKGTKHGTTTNKQGRYSLKVPNNATTLVFSFLGYKNKEVSINGRN